MTSVESLSHVVHGERREIPFFKVALDLSSVALMPSTKDIQLLTSALKEPKLLHQLEPKNHQKYQQTQMIPQFHQVAQIVVSLQMQREEHHFLNLWVSQTLILLMDSLDFWEELWKQMRSNTLANATVAFLKSLINLNTNLRALTSKTLWTLQRIGKKYRIHGASSKIFLQRFPTKSTIAPQSLLIWSLILWDWSQQ